MFSWHRWRRDDSTAQGGGSISSHRVVKHLLLVCALAWLAVTGPAIASEYHGLVTFNGLPVPGTMVTVTATQGGKTVAAITNDQGLYSFPDLADGKWTIDIEMTGFAPVKQDVTIAPNAPAGTFEMKLMSLDQIRASAKPLKVEAAPIVSASAASPGNNATPSAGKGAAAAAAKAAGANTEVAKAAVPDSPIAAPDPNAQQANDGFLINGSVNNAATSQYSQSQAFGNSRMGRSMYNGGISLVLDNSAFNAKPYSLAGLDSPKPSSSNIVVGITFGGPVKIPRLMPRGAYFYVSYQRTQRSLNSTAAALVPTLAQRSGDLSRLSGSGQTIYAPSTGLSAACLAAPGVVAGSAFAGNVIPAACISPAAQTLLKFYPVPNVTGNLQYNYQIPLTSGTHQDMYAISLNKSIGNKNFLNGRFNLQSTRSSNPSLFGFSDATNLLGINLGVHWYHRVTQRLALNTDYQFSRLSNRGNPYFANRENVEAEANITGVNTDPVNWGPPSLSFSSGVYGLYDGTSSFNRNQTNGVSVSLDWSRFRHTIRFGGDFRRQQFNYLEQANPRGTFAFTGAATQGAAPTGGSDLADLLLGVPDTSQIAYGNADKYLRQSVYDAFINDDFRVNPELTINAGLRWEYGAPVTELKGRLVNLDIAPGFTAETPVLANTPKGALTGRSYPTSLLRPDKIGIAPIIGIALRPISGSSLLIRAGYGIYHDTSVYQATAYAMAQQSPLSKSLSLNNSACPLTLTQGFNSCPSITPNTFAVDPDFRVGYAQAWQLQVQRDLPGSLQVVATYAGIKGSHGVQEILPNTCPPTLPGTPPCSSSPSGYYYRTSNGSSNREAGTITLRRRLRSGFLANLTYTFAKSLDDDYSLGGQGPVTAGNSSEGSSQVAQDWRNPGAQRGLSTFDQRHVLSAQTQYTTGMGLGGKTLMSGWRGGLYKEWTVLAVISAASGLPETPIYPVAVPGTGYTGIVRGNYTGGRIHETSLPGLFLNPAAFTPPTPGQWGNARRDSITGPNQFSLNVSMDRTFRLSGRYNLEARLDAVNALNHVAYTSWNTIVGNSQFGSPAGAGAMRTMQVTMRLRF